MKQNHSEVSLGIELFRVATIFFCISQTLCKKGQNVDFCSAFSGIQTTYGNLYAIASKELSPISPLILNEFRQMN